MLPICCRTAVPSARVVDVGVLATIGAIDKRPWAGDGEVCASISTPCIRRP
jgi:hypothetical protein